MGIPRDSAFLLTSQVTGFVLGILTSIVVSRVLGPSNLGVYFMVITVNAMVVNFGNFGVDFTNTYLLAKGKRSLNEVHSNSVVMAALTGGAILVGYWFSAGLLHRTILKGIDPLFTILAICLMPLTLYNRYWGSMMVGLSKFELISNLNIAVGIVETTITFVILLVFKWGIKGLLGWWVLNSVILTLIKLDIVNRIERIKIVFSLRLFMEVLSFGFKGYIGNIAYYLYNRLDMFVVNYFVGVTGVGYYSLSVSLAERTWFLPGPLLSATTPKIGRAAQEESGTLTARVIRHTILLSSVTSVLLLIIAPWLIPIFYGKEYISSVGPLLILLPGTIFVVVDMALSSYFTFQQGRPYIPSICAWVMVVLYIPFSIVVIARLGIIGAALTSTITYIIGCLIMLFLFKRASEVGFLDLFLIRLSDLLAYMKLLSQIYKRLQKFTAKVSPYRWFAIKRYVEKNRSEGRDQK